MANYIDPFTRITNVICEATIIHYRISSTGLTLSGNVDQTLSPGQDGTPVSVVDLINDTGDPFTAQSIIFTYWVQDNVGYLDAERTRIDNGSDFSGEVTLFAVGISVDTFLRCDRRATYQKLAGGITFKQFTRPVYGTGTQSSFTAINFTEEECNANAQASADSISPWGPIATYNPAIAYGVIFDNPPPGTVWANTDGSVMPTQPYNNPMFEIYNGSYSQTNTISEILSQNISELPDGGNAGTAVLSSTLTKTTSCGYTGTYSYVAYDADTFFQTKVTIPEIALRVTLPDSSFKYILYEYWEPDFGAGTVVYIRMKVKANT